MNEQELVTIPEKAELIVLFADKGLDPLLKKIKSEVDAFVPDLSTAKGRSEIASMAYKVSQSKTFLDNAGKGLVDKLKEQPKTVDAERRRMRDWCDALRDEVRKPLSDWEAEEEKRLADLQLKLASINEYKDVEFETADEAKIALDGVHKILVDDSFCELKEQAESDHEIAILKLEKLISTLAEQEDAFALAEKDRLAKIEQDRIEREAKIAEDAAKEATAQAESAAKAKAEDVQRKAKEAQAAEENRQAAIKKEAETRELELKLKAERAYKEKLEAEQRAKQAESDAIAKVAAEKQAEIDAEKKREANKKHKAKINNEALQAIELCGVNADTSKAIICAIAKGEIPNVKISY